MIRCLGGNNSVNKNLHNSSLRMIPLGSGAGGLTLESDVINILRSITPSLGPARHKGQAGDDANHTSCSVLFIYFFVVLLV